MIPGLSVDDAGNVTLAVNKDSTFVKTEVLMDKDGNPHFDLWEPPFEHRAQKGDTIHTVTSADAGRPDLIAYHYYRNVNLYWLICHFNKILHPINELVPGRKLIIPNAKTVSAYLSSAGV
jgi:hypothetical protein